MSTPLDLLIIPTPRHIRPGDGWLPVPTWATADLLASLLPHAESLDHNLASDRARHPAHDWPAFLAATKSASWCGSSTLESQGYTLTIAESLPIQLSAPTAAGLRYALATLAQLLRQFPQRLPRLTISDSPSIATRGVMLDVSRDRIPTMAKFREIIDDLSRLKINHLQLYTEHTFAYTGHVEVWQGWSPLTPDEIRELDDFAHARGIELAANQNCFGHLRQWLKHPKYAELAETHGDWIFDVWKRSGPFSLCPTDPKSLSLVRDLLEQLTPCFRSRFVNIGCDETYDVGFGRSKHAVEQRGRAAVCLDFVKDIDAIVRSLDRRSLFWADIALSHPDLVAQIPGDMTALAWGYEPTSPFGDWATQLCRRPHGSDHAWLCPGTSSWRSLAGRTTERRSNIAAAAHAALEHGVAGFLTCDWGDTGHWQQWPISMLGLAHGAQASWNSQHAAHFDPRAASLHALHDQTLQAAAWLESLGDADLPLRETCLGLAKEGASGRLLNQSAVFIDLFKHRDELLHIGDRVQWDAAADRTSELAAARPITGNAQLDRELSHTASFMNFAATRASARRQPGGLSASRLHELSSRFEAIRDEHIALWHTTSRPGGLTDSLSHFETVAKAL